jgi:hypothetical protein
VVLDQKGKVQVHEQPRGWMGNGRGCVHVSKRAYGRELERKGREGTCEKSRQAGRPREIHEERKDERRLDVRKIDVNNVNVAVAQR